MLLLTAGEMTEARRGLRKMTGREDAPDEKNNRKPGEEKALSFVLDAANVNAVTDDSRDARPFTDFLQ
jgi:hypothetical protein